MAVTYRAGDVFAILLDTGTYALCQVLWAPQGDYRKVVGFCVLEQHAAAPTLGPSPGQPLPVRDGDKDMWLLFTGTQKLKSGDWQLIGHAPLPSAPGSC
ncbi:immunity 26/phosphotriesterase HocA family protein [Xanthomonas indica]|uniref:Immunity 26/phosphotriesterase HocA family protein n=1 Tax=Xanthomonas indica TaxID=2912242 RepID=A0AAU8I775_9XANT|nr:immunity 26/phosphotriesterase HocA family protein [Xanthomonas indica]MCI2260612.1 immunity 26/phosphotriesterase HocA family protein [Xanthomonas indica]